MLYFRINDFKKSKIGLDQKVFSTYNSIEICRKLHSSQASQERCSDLNGAAIFTENQEVISLHCIEADKIIGMKESGYFLQRTLGRKLSDSLHSHTFYELLYVASGSCTHECNGEYDNISAGDFVFITPKIAHRFTAQSDNCDVIAISVICEEMQKFMSIFDEGLNICDCFKIRLSFEQRSIFMMLYEKNADNKSISRTSAGRIILNQLLLFYVNPISGENMPLSFLNAVEQIQNPQTAIKGIDAFLKISGYSHSQLCRLTKKYFNTTPTEYINRIRMRYAYRLVLDTSDDYETICDKVGFESFSYFCKLFKKYYGCSVASVRKEDIYITRTV